MAPQIANMGQGQAAVGMSQPLAGQTGGAAAVQHQPMQVQQLASQVAASVAATVNAAATAQAVVHKPQQTGTPVNP